jgi:RHS repeat-associated protein
VTRTFDEFGNVLTETAPGVGTWSYEYSYTTAPASGGGQVMLHRMTRSTAPNGGVMAYTYDGANMVPSKVEGPEGYRVVNKIDDGLVVASTDADGVTTLFTYDSYRRLVRVADGVGNTTGFGYDAVGRITGITDPAGKSTVMSYDQVGRLLSVTDRSGAVTTRTYDEAGRVTGLADALDRVPGITSRASFGYDQAGLLARSSDQRSNVTTFEYNDFGQMISLNKPGAAQWTFEFSQLGRLDAMTDPLGAARRTGYGYDVEGSLDQVTAPDGTTAGVMYDDADRPVRITDRNGIVSSFVYDATGGGTLLSESHGVGTRDEITMGYTYDRAYQPRTVTGPRPGQARSYTYTPAGRVATVIDPNGNRVSFNYDPAGRVASVVLPGNRVVGYVYDANSRVTAVVSPLGLRYETSYDEVGRVVGVRSPAGVETRFTYNPNGTVTSTQIGDDQPVRFDVDALVMNQATNPNGGQESMDYDGRYNLTRWVDQNGHASTFTYDAADEVVAMADPLGRLTTYTYDTLGRVSGLADPSGRTFTPTYDPGGRLASVGFADGSLQRFSYDNLNRVTQVADVNPDGVVAGTTNFEFDQASNLTRVAEPDGDVVAYQWDLAGNQTKITYPDGSSVAYGYDELNRMISAVHSGQGETRYQWDNDSRLTEAVFPNGGQRRYRYHGEQLTQFSDAGRTWNLAYDHSGRLKRITGAETRTFTYDNGGQLATATNGRQRLAYTYDPAGNLTNITETTTNRHRLDRRHGDHDGYSRGGDRDDRDDRRSAEKSSTTYTHDAANQLLTANVDGMASSFVYDNAGRLTRETKTNGDLIAYSYDIRGRLTAVVTTTATTAGRSGHRRDDHNRGPDPKPETVTWARTYTPDGLLATVTRTTTANHRGSGGDQVWDLSWDRSRNVPQPLGWTTTNDKTGGAVLVHGVGPAFSIDTKGKATNIAVGPLGEVIGSPIAVAGAYDPFGGPVGDDHRSGDVNDSFGMGYRGELHVGPTINLKARDLNPTLNRFLTSDPVARPAGSAASSRYAYAANDPINMIDPHGLAPTDNSFALFVEKQINEFSLADFGRGVAGYGLDALKDLIDLGKMAWSGAKCLAAQATFGLFGSCDEVKALVDGALQLGKSIYGAVKDRNVGAVLDIISAFLPERCGFATFELDYCAGYGTAAIVAQLVTGGAGASAKLGLLAKVADLVPTKLTDAVHDVAKHFPENSPAGAFCSFSGDTQVVLANGTTKPISEMAIGDEVLPEDPETGERGPREVTHLWVHRDTLIDLTIDGAQLATTEDHPFWNHTDQQWQRADALEAGDQLLTPNANPVTLNTTNTTTQSTTTAYNLTINDIHTYYVSVGHQAVLVHNTCPDLPNATEAGGARFVVNSAGDALDTARVTIPGGKYGYLLENPSKSGVFADSMGFNQASLDSALRSHLVNNFGTATPSVPMVGGGTKFSVTGPMVGPSGAKWTITSAWGVDADGAIRLITATP